MRFCGELKRRMDPRVKPAGDGRNLSRRRNVPMLAPNPNCNPTAAAVFITPTSIAADGTVEGYASRFGELDQARDMVMPGAFRQTLETRNIRRVPMLFQHDPAEPVGVWLELREDMHGLYARGRLIPDVVRGATNWC